MGTAVALLNDRHEAPRMRTRSGTARNDSYQPSATQKPTFRIVGGQRHLIRLLGHNGFFARTA